MVSLQIEQSLWDKGIEHIAFCDEVGRGPLLGSVVAAAVILPIGLLIEEVDDSKKLSLKKREFLYDKIIDSCLAFGVGEVDSTVIDEINIRQASRLAMKQAVQNLTNHDGVIVKPDYLLIDCETIDLDIPQRGIVHGDALSHGIAAASIIGKVVRDRKCLEWDEAFPNYGIARHKGYSTKSHIEALLTFGPTALHRRTFLRKIIARATIQQQQLFNNI